MVREDGLVSENVEGYQITSELGSNAFSSAFLGEPISPTASYQRVIIKLFYTTHASTMQEQQDILQKISELQQVQHPHILPILSAGMHKDRHYVIMEYLASGSLHDRLQQRLAEQPMQQEQAFRIIAQVGQALQYAHQHNVIHGHLKPQNVLFNIRNEALVTDFHRYALQLPDATDTDSPDAFLYQAPEQLTGYTSEKSDQYALASLAYTLLTGHRAFMIPSIHTPGVYYKTKALIAPGRLNAALPSHIEEAILKAMSRDPDQRYVDIATFLAALRLPPATGNRAMRETLVTLAEIMQHNDDSDLPVTPVLKSNIREALQAHMANEATITPSKELTIPQLNALPTLPDQVQPVGPFTFPVFSSSPLNALRKDDPLTFADAFLLDASDETLAEAEQATLKIPQAHAVRNNSRLQNITKRLKSKPQQTIAILICLLTVAIVFATTSINLNSMTPTKLSGTPSSAQGTSTATSSPIGALSPGVTKHGTPASGVKIPPQNATPHATSTTGSTPTTAPTSAPIVAPTPAPKQIQLPVTLTAFFNNNAFGNAPGQANFDGSRYSYPASQLPGSGRITIQGIPYQFLNNGSGTNDNIIASGRSISVPRGNYRQAFLLVAASWGPISSSVTTQYTNGSTSHQNISVPDWYHGIGVLNTTYRYTPNSIDPHAVAIYTLSISLDSNRSLQALTFSQSQSSPYRNARIHVFALTLLS